MDRKKLAEMMAEYQAMSQKERPVMRFGDTGAPAGPLDVLDSVTGAPFRAGVSRAQEGDLVGGVKAILQRFGKDPSGSPSMEDIAIRAGVPEGYASKAAGLLGGFAEPGIPFMGAMGAVKRVGKSNVFDATEEFLKRKQMAPDRLAQAQGLTDNPIAKMPKTKKIPYKTLRDVIQSGETKKYVDKIAKKIVYNPDDDDLKHFSDIFERYAEKPNVLQSFQAAQGSSSAYVPTQGAMVPNFNYKNSGRSVFGQPGVSENFAEGPGNWKLIPETFPWQDNRYKVALKALKKAKGPVTINTSSDLIAGGEYINSIPEGSTINLYAGPANQYIHRRLFPGNASNDRLKAAAKKLESVGLKVNYIEATFEDLVRLGKDKYFQKNYGRPLTPEDLLDD